jgi:multidrug transporter EmrE-like cation transporter
MTLLNVLLMSCSEIFANSNLQKFASNKTLTHLIMGITGYALVLYFLIRSFAHGNMLWVTSMWEGMIIVLSAAYAFFILGETMPNFWGYLGLAFAFLAMCCVQYGEVITRTAATAV